MTLKKSLITTALGLSILCFSTGASAAENNEGLVDSDVYQSFKQSTTGFSIRATPTNSSRTDTYKPWGKTEYAVSKSSSTTFEDYIYARCRAFDSDGSLISSKNSSANNSSYVATSKVYNTTASVGNDYALGNHTYKLSGYKDVIHETKANW